MKNSKLFGLVSLEELEDRLLLVDTGSLIHPAFYVLKGLSTSDGFPTGAIYGFTRTLIKLLREFPSRYVAACFDLPGKTFRHEKYKSYKATRPKMDEKLVVQIPIIKDIIKALGISIFEKTGYEADDIIATLAKIASQKNWPVFCVTSDKDLLQLVSDQVFVLKPARSDPNSSFECIEAKEVKERLGVSPSKVGDFLALSGDSADNIPGVPYVGEKRAAQLLNKYDSVKEVLENRTSIKNRRVKESLEESIEDLNLSLELVKLDYNVPLDRDHPLEDCKISPVDKKDLTEIFTQLEFKSILSELDQNLKDKDSK